MTKTVDMENGLEETGGRETSKEAAIVKIWERLKSYGRLRRKWGSACKTRCEKWRKKKSVGVPGFCLGPLAPSSGIGKTEVEAGLDEEGEGFHLGHVSLCCL
jgi:hypothetical protein